MYRPKIIEIDELDLNILTLLAPNTRLPAIDLAKQLNVTTVTIANRIKNS